MKENKDLIEQSMEEEIGVEVWWRYDWIAYYLDKGKKYSRVAHIPIEEDELCKYGKIYKVEQIGDYDFKIISERPDQDCFESITK